MNINTHPIMKNKADHLLASGVECGFAFLVLHNGIGYRCGYICIPLGHPWHGIDGEKIEADVHGGLTYSKRGSDGSWWVGFDCAHCFDAQDPSLLRSGQRLDGMGRGEIRTTEYVYAECVKLCAQAKKAADILNN